MKKLHHKRFANIFAIMVSIIMCAPGFADDTCMFSVTADDLPPNIVILLDNGAEMEHIVWHPKYVDADYTPIVATMKDVVEKGKVDPGNGFFRDRGYGIVETGNKYYLVEIPDNLDLSGYAFSLEADISDTANKRGTWIINGRTITLPAEPSSAVDGNGIKDNSANFRYSKNYLNWLFFGDYSNEGSGDGSDLPGNSRFYYAKAAVMTAAKLTSNQGKFGIYNFTSNSEGASNVQPLGMVVNEPLAADPTTNTLDLNFVNNVNNMGTVTYSPLAEGLATIAGYFNSPSSSLPAPLTEAVDEYCQKLFAIVVSPGYSSEDLDGNSTSYFPKTRNFVDDDGDNDAGGIGEGNIRENDGLDNDVDGSIDEDDEAVHIIPTNQNGSTYLDDIAYYLRTQDCVGYRDGVQTTATYTVGFMGDQESNLFLINTSNNGNGNVNLYDSNDPEYGKYHFTAQSPNALSEKLLAAVNDILARTSTFTAPVVPVTRTMSGNRIYMAFFKPAEGNFWQGNLTKFGLSADTEIVDANGNPATYPNGSMKEGAEPYWETKDWSDATKSNYMHNSGRNIYTYLGSSTDLTDLSNEFVSTNAGLSPAVLGGPSHTTAEIINYLRGADVFDADGDANITENREIITGDILHSEPMVVQYNNSTTMVYFGSNDGMLHAVSDASGLEEWAFIPPDLLHRLKDIVEGVGHQYFVDSSPKAYIKDVNGNGIIEADGDVDGDSIQDDMDDDGDVDADDMDRVILVCGERKGGTSYFALDVSYPSSPIYLWRISQYWDHMAGTLELTSVNGTWLDDDFADHYPSDDPLVPPFDAWVLVNGTPVGNVLRYDNIWPGSMGSYVGERVFAYRAASCPTCYSDNVYGTIVSVSEDAPYSAPPTFVAPELGETWSEPQFGLVKTSDVDTTGTPVFFVGGGYSSDNSKGKAVFAINVETAAVVRIFSGITGMNYSFPSAVAVLDTDSNGFVDKLYVGDAGGQMWRIGKFTDALGNPLNFPDADENINNWTAQLLFRPECGEINCTDGADNDGDGEIDESGPVCGEADCTNGVDDDSDGNTDESYMRRFFYPPEVTLEQGYDLVFAGTGDREDACVSTTSDRIYAIKDTHAATTLSEEDLVDVTNEAATPPNLNDATGDVDSNGFTDQGWYIKLEPGEKVLAEGTVFYKAFYVTTFTPNNEPCVPGGDARIYALSHLTGAAVLDFDNSGTASRSKEIGGGIPSKPVTVITPEGATLLISVGSTSPDAASLSVEAGIVTEKPMEPPANFFYLWWREVF